MSSLQLLNKVDCLKNYIFSLKMVHGSLLSGNKLYESTLRYVRLKLLAVKTKPIKKQLLMKLLLFMFATCRSYIIFELI